jgi:DNA-binding MarR family transcriptional regulator
MLAYMQAIAPETAPAVTETGLAGDLYALVTHLHKNCTGDLLEALGLLDLNLSQSKLLHRLESAGRELSLGQVADSVGISLPTASRLVDDLVRRGLVERREDDSDRRLKRVGLSASGQAALRQLNAARLNGLQEFTVTLTDTERATLAETVQTLLKRPEIAACRYEARPR